MSEMKENCTLFTAQPVSFAMAYVPLQPFEKLYEPSVGFERGTVFSALDKPFIGEEAVADDK